MKKRVMLFSSCVVRDSIELDKRFQVVQHISQSALSSAFATKSFNTVSDDLIKTRIEHEFLRKCVRRDMFKQTRQILLDSDYDAIIIDYIDERYNLALFSDSRATYSNALKSTGIRNTAGIKLLRTWSLRRLRWWLQGIQELTTIATQKRVPVLLPRIYPAFRNEQGKIRIKRFDYCLQNHLWLKLLYRLTPQQIQQIAIPRNLLLMADNHPWGGKYMYHYTPPFYENLAEALYKAL